jgi:hypothetical protein
MNSFQKWAIEELTYAGFKAGPRGNWVEVFGGYYPEPIYTVQGVHDYISKNEPVGEE